MLGDYIRELRVPNLMEHMEHMDHSGHHEAMAATTHGGSDMCSMNMLFTWDPTNLCVVFKWWHVRTTPGLILTLLAIIALSAGYEYLRYRIRIIDNERAAASSIETRPQNRVRQSIGYALQVGYSYLLMLIFMTYNGWAMLAVAVGAGLGFWFWGDKAQRQMSCH